jgi:16S rRNA (guanine527-N7)-methyltransferase
MRDADGFGPEEVIAATGVSRETIERVEEMVARLREWSGRMNLVSRSQLDCLWRRHVWDSLALIPHLGAAREILDIGSGSGFPAGPVGCWIAAEGRGGTVTMVERTGKKADYLRAVAEIAPDVFHVKHSGVEALRGLGASCVTARAVAPLTRLVSLARPWFENGAFGLFHKGRNHADELTEASRHWQLDSQVLPNRANSDGVILRIALAE